MHLTSVGYSTFHISLIEVSYYRVILLTVYIRILTERKTQNTNAEIVGSAYMVITIMML